MSSQATPDTLQRNSVFLSAPSLACNLNAFSAQQQARYNALLTTLSLYVGEARELENGYEIAFPVDAAIGASVVEFAALERLC